MKLSKNNHYLAHAGHYLRSNYEAARAELASCIEDLKREPDMKDVLHGNESCATGASVDRRALLIWLLPNVVALVAYLYLASWTWLPPGAKESAPGPGDPIIWVLTAFPVLALGAGFNLAWMIRIRVEAPRRGWRPLAWWLLAVAAWVLANRYDAFRS